MARRFRTVIAAVCGTIAVVGLVAATLGTWANRNLYDSDTFAATVNDTLAEPAVTGALADYLTDQVVRVVPTRTAVDRLVPPEVDRVFPGTTGGLTSRIDDRLAEAVHTRFEQLLTNPTVRGHLVTAVRVSHATMVQAIDTGGIANLRLTEGAVTLNLLPMVADGLDALPPNRLTAGIGIPELAYGGDHATQVAELSTALGVDLPPDLGLIDVYRGPAAAQAHLVLTQVQQALVLFHKTLVGILVGTVAALALTWVVAPNRRRATMALLVGAVGGFAFARAAIRTAVDQTGGVSADPATAQVAETVVAALARGLLRLLSVALVVSLVAWALVGLIGVLRARTAPHRAVIEPPRATLRRIVATVLAFVAAAILLLSGLTPLSAVLAAGCAVAAAVAASSAGFRNALTTPPGVRGSA